MFAFLKNLNKGFQSIIVLTVRNVTRQKQEGVIDACSNLHNAHNNNEEFKKKTLSCVKMHFKKGDTR